MKKGKVSVVVPVYNAEQYLEACVRSVLTQTYENWELILVNDGSSDGSEGVCRSLANTDERILFMSQENRGVSSARNAGIAKATGQYITFLDSDDILEANALGILVSDIIQYNADISSASQSYVGSDGTAHCMDNDGCVSVYKGDDMIKRSLMHDAQTHSANAKLYSVKFIDGLSFVAGRNINEDGYFLFECYTRKPKVVHRNVSIYQYIYREGSASNGSFSEKYFDMLYFCNLKAAYIREHMPHLLDEAKNMEARTHLLFLQVLCRTNDKRYKKAQNESVKAVRRLRRYYRPINSHHKLLVWLVTCGLYPLYKKMVRLKYFR